jgi:capsular polysaccharide transport system permease protein
VSGEAVHEVGFGQALRIQIRVIGALLMREMATRFGRDNLGYLWLFAEPLMLGGAVSLVHHASGGAMPGGINVTMFAIIGYMPFYALRGVINRAPSAVVANQSLLYHRRVTLLDIVVARNLLEGMAVTGAMALFLGWFGMTLDEWPQEPALVFIGMIAMVALAHGLSMVIAACSIVSELPERITHLLTYLSMPFTGAFYMVFWLPTEVQEAALLLPTLHCYELMRFGMYGTKVPTTFDVGYILIWIAGLNLAGMLALRVARRKLVV